MFVVRVWISLYIAIKSAFKFAEVLGTFFPATVVVVVVEIGDPTMVVSRHGRGTTPFSHPLRITGNSY